MKKLKNIHIVIIIAGIIFNSISIFHPNLWFDEAYSVGLANKSFADIWTIGGNDVHPILYYYVLHIIYLILNGLGVGLNGIIIGYRVFSAFCISMLGILGFSHIRKDFGEKTGALFSFFSYFMPVICIYTAEVRMYSLAILVVTILAIYAYRLAKNGSETKIKDWAIFGISSLMCIYTHYYGLMAAGIINCILLFYLIKEKRKKDIITIIVLGIIQAIAYIPWIMCFITQLKNVSKGFWIGFEFPKTIFQLFGTQFSGNLKDIIGFIFVIALYIYIIFKIFYSKRIKKTRSNEDEKKNDIYAIISIAIYFAVILAAVIITAVMKTSILYYRYLFVITGLFIFFISYYLSKENNKYFVLTICIITLVLAGISNYKQIKDAYEENNMTQISYLNENVKQDDVIVINETELGTGTVIALNYTNNKQIYYNPSNWGVEAAYRAFGEQFSVCTNLDFLNECNGRIWVIDNENSDYYNKQFNNQDYQLISSKMIKTGYKGYVYNMILVEKVN